ncbi:hypothetical protein C8R46DRAFT_1294431 [Mycena filopes]|nr:hypothetical protein C8R46DRAFT_1294431 [Mycena filopes]
MSESSFIQTSSLTHELVIRQMPVQVCSSRKEEEWPRVLNPMPVIELTFYNDNEERINVLLHQGLTGYMMRAEIEDRGDSKTGAICGTYLSSIFPVPDPVSGATHLYFAFPDLGIRASGVFRLRFTLHVMSP